MRAKRVTRTDPNWRWDGVIGVPVGRVDDPALDLSRYATKLPRHDQIVTLLDKINHAAMGSPQYGGPQTDAGCARTRKIAESCGSREVAVEILTRAEVNFDRAGSDTYLLSRAIAHLETELRDMSQEIKLDAEIAAETERADEHRTDAEQRHDAFVFSERNRWHRDGTTGRGIDRSTFLERERNAWRQDHGPLAASGRPMSEIEAEIAEHTGEI